MMSAVTDVVSGDSLQQEFARRGPWLTRYLIGDQEYGGHLDYWRDPRLALFAQAFPRVRTILELGSLEGGHSFELARRPGVERVVAIEGREDNVDRARFVKDVLGLSHVEFVVANLEEYPLAPLGRFDVVFCSGLLYHLPKPWLLLKRIAGISDQVFIWTHYATDAMVATGWRLALKRLLRRPAGYTFGESGLKDPLSGMSATSFWPTLDGLRRMLARAGFTEQRVLNVELEHPHTGPAITLAASKG
jgi:SAM-dependent methyltransferase